jgi:hypothetical protein
VKVTLKYYDRGGNYVGEGSYNTYMNRDKDIYREVENRNKVGMLPGVEGGVWSEGYIQIFVPNGKSKIIFCDY